MKSLRDLYKEGIIHLGDVAEPELESRLLLCKSVSVSEEEFHAHGKREITREQERIFFRLIEQRNSGIPLAYVTHTKEFWSIPFDIYPGVLIPRPETELIVEKVIGISSRREEVIVDIGTGSGNIAIALARELPEAQIIATDVSRTALRVAKSNAARMSIPNVKFINGSLFLPLEGLKLRETCDFIVSNPPYVAKREWKTLPSEIKKHEPRRALIAGETGLEFIRELVKGAPEFLKPGGYLVLEMGYGQRREVLSMFGKKWSRVRSFKDLSGIPRVIAARKRIR